MRCRALLFVLTGLAAAGCGGEAFQGGEPPVLEDASADDAPEAAVDAAKESAADAPADVATPDNVAPDVSPDVPPVGCNNGEKRSCYDGPAGTQGQGQCKAGIMTCQSGTWGPCVDQVVPAADICNGLDDDCDGVIDANCSCTPGENENCGTDTGECTMGVQTCQSDGTWGDCAGAINPTP